jgi:GNAT superfamily N-acetyltransferase
MAPTHSIGNVAAVEQPLAAATATPVRVEAVNGAPREELVVRHSIAPADLRCLLRSLVTEDCAHSWRNFGADGTVEELRAWENQRRPTELFFFYVQRARELRLLGAGAVADKLTRDFPHPGFCVLGRCYVMPEFRGQGFYRRILRYRLEYCRTRFGSGLKGIHIGTENERVAVAITNHHLAEWPRFIHLGEEELRIAGHVWTVADYMLLLPDYVASLRHTLAGARAPACILKLRKLLAGIESGEIRNVAGVMKQHFDEARAQGWFDRHNADNLEQLLLFCSFIPLVGFTGTATGRSE